MRCVVLVCVCAWLRVEVSGLVEEASWWRSAVYYRMLVDSFKDGDGDGLGDLMGATKQLSYLKALGADSVILSPIVARSKDCSSPGPIDLTELDSRFGSLADLTNLLNKGQKLELKVVITLPMQAMSTTSQWFIDSAEQKRGFDDWMLWSKGEAGGTPAVKSEIHDWILHEGRSEYWAASNNESVLNLCSEGVTAALAAAQCAWLRRGVAGVVLNPDFPTDKKCSHKLVAKMAAEAMSCARANGLDTPLILIETSDPPELSSKYLSNSAVGVSVISNALAYSERRTAAELIMSFHEAITYTSEDAAPSWITTASDMSHICNRLGNEMVDVTNLLTLILPGAAIIQQGDELGTADTIVDWAKNDVCWPNRLLPSSAPFSWDATASAGFSNGESWLPLATNYRYANAKTQFNYESSHVGVVRTAAAMRKSPAIGPHVEIKRLGEALAILRWGGTGSLLLVCNVGLSQAEIQISNLPGLPLEMTVATSSAGSRYAPGSHVNLEKLLKLGSAEAILLAGPPRHCGGPGPVDKITNKLQEGWQKINKYFNTR